MLVVFRAFDSDSSGALSRSEVREVLLSSKLPKERCEIILNTMFKGEPDQEMEWEVFRLWLKRDGFASREMCWQEQMFNTFEEPGK